MQVNHFIISMNMINNKFNFVRDGQTKLPPGFRFDPSDEQIVFHYLARKIFSHPLPASVIPEISSVFSFNPWDLPGDSEQDRYFFADRELSHPRRSIVSGKNCGGFWKVCGSDRRISCSKRIPIVGMKKTLVFYEGSHPYAARTHWFMDVYCVALSPNAPSNTRCKRHFQGSVRQIGKWVVCHVFARKRNAVSDFVAADTSDHTCSSSSSSSSSSSDFDSDSGSDSDSSVLSEVNSSSGSGGSKGY